MKEVDQSVGKNTSYHLYILQRIAGIQKIKRDLDGMEETFTECINIAENSPYHKGQNKEASRLSNIFQWQNNLLKFYLDNNIDKAIDYGHELIDDLAPMLPAQSQQDLKFTVATAQSLKCYDLDGAIKLYESTLYLEDDDQETLAANPDLLDMRAVIYNNLGITHFFNFMELTSTVQGPDQLKSDQVQPIVNSMQNSIKSLKKSVLHFEQVEQRLKGFES